MQDIEQQPIEEEKKQVPLTRQQRRAIERANLDAQKTHSHLVGQYNELFMQNDPDSDIVQNKLKEVSAKWRMYAKSHKLKTEFENAVEQSCKKIYDEYKAEIAGK